MADLKKKSNTELEKMLADSREQLRKFRFSMSGAKTRNVKEGRDLKREIAQVLTELNARNK